MSASPEPRFELQHAAALETIRSLNVGDTIQRPWLDSWIDWEVRAVLVEDERVVARLFQGGIWAYEIATAPGFHVGLWRKKP